MRWAPRRAARPPGAWARRAALRAMLSKLKQSWRVHVQFGSAMALLILVMQRADTPWQRGFFTGFAVMLSAGAVLFGTMVSAESALHRWNGADAEVLTSDCFRHRRRRRQGWCIVHGLQLEGCDIDHVAVGPAGVLALETKWIGGTPWRLVDSSLEGPIGEPILQARRAAAKVALLLRSVSGGPPVVAPVQPVLVMWGPGTPDLDDRPPTVDGVLLVDGARRAHWQHLFGQAPMDRSAVDTIARKVSSYATEQWRVLRGTI